MRGNWLSIGALRPVVVSFMEKDWDVLGLSGIVSLEREKGYGKDLLDAVKDYLDPIGATSVGFCEPNNAPFYTKCGFETDATIAKNFVYIDAEGKEIIDTEQLVVYRDGANRFVSQVLEERDVSVHIPIPHW